MRKNNIRKKRRYEAQQLSAVGIGVGCWHYTEGERDNKDRITTLSSSISSHYLRQKTGIIEIDASTDDVENACCGVSQTTDTPHRGGWVGWRSVRVCTVQCQCFNLQSISQHSV
jgi:hypothetical protein